MAIIQAEAQMNIPPAAKRLIKHIALPRAKWRGQTKLHLGCGGNLITGWGNVDFDGPAHTIRHDLTKSLPIAAGTIDFIYSEHFIEHIRRDQAVALLAECRRVLRSGGVLRLVTPDLDKLIEEYQAGRTTEWADMGWSSPSPCIMLNEGVRNWGHQFLYNRSELEAVLNEAGFSNKEWVAWRMSRHLELQGLECRAFHNELIIEATK
jgi:predicted SAM-dependent methyltransferase